MERICSESNVHVLKIMRQCRVSEPTAKVIGELAGIKPVRDFTPTSEIVSTALGRLAELKREVRL